MDKKLTLSLNEHIIEQAKVYAKDHQISLSKLVEAYLGALVEPESDSAKITPLVESLSGVISISNDFDHRSSYADFLTEKYR